MYLTSKGKLVFHHPLNTSSKTILYITVRVSVPYCISAKECVYICLHIAFPVVTVLTNAIIGFDCSVYAQILFAATTVAKCHLPLVNIIANNIIITI